MTLPLSSVLGEFWREMVTPSISSPVAGRWTGFGLKSDRSWMRCAVSGFWEQSKWRTDYRFLVCGGTACVLEVSLNGPLLLLALQHKYAYSEGGYAV